MLRKLRLKFVVINMAIVTAMLCVIFGLIYHSTRVDLEQENLNMMRAIASFPALDRPGRPDEPPEEVRLIENTGVMNRILMRLNEGDNKTALSLIMGMENLDAEGYYVKAVCYARNNLTTAAQDLLKKAIDMKPELENVAKGDADVFEVYKLLKEKKK